MRKVYIYDDYRLSSGNGIGTFLKEFIRCVIQWEDVYICMIMLYANSKNIHIGRKGELEYIFIPKELCKNPFENCEPLISILEEYIIDAESTFFLFNYTPSDRLMRATRNFFPLSSQVCIIHDFSWTAPLLGDIELFQNSIIFKSNVTTSQYAEIIKLYQREVEQYNMADIVICLSEDAYSILQDCYFVPKKKIRLIPHGIDAIKKKASALVKQKLREKYYLNDDDKVILMVGRISRAKGMFDYLDAFKKVLKKDSSCRLVIVGELCNAPTLLANACESNVKITLTGLLNREQLSYWYQMADIGVIPSYSEQCGYVGLEMMGYGLPVIASDGLGVRCMFKNEINALVAPIGKRNSNNTFVNNLANNTLRLLNDLKLHKSLKDNALQILKKKYVFSEMEKHYKAIFMA